MTWRYSSLAALIDGHADLAGIGKLRDHGWLTRYVTTPDLVLAEGDPTARRLFAKYKDVRMPNLELSLEDAEAILRYVEIRGASP